MAKLNFNFELQTDTTDMVKACKNASKAIQKLSQALEDIHNSKILIREVKPPPIKKWYEFHW